MIPNKASYGWYRMRNYRRERHRRGFTLLSAAVCGAALFGAAGLAFDIGRIYITKSESQGYADAAAVAGALKLDGTSAGLTASDNAVGASINRWGFSTTAFSGTVVDYSADGTSGWATSGSQAAHSRGRERARETRMPSSLSESSTILFHFAPMLRAIASSSSRFCRATAAVFLSPAFRATRSSI